MLAPSILISPIVGRGGALYPPGPRTTRRRRRANPSASGTWGSDVRDRDPSRVWGPVDLLGPAGRAPAFAKCHRASSRRRRTRASRCVGSKRMGGLHYASVADRVLQVRRRELWSRVAVEEASLQLVEAERHRGDWELPVVGPDLQRQVLARWQPRSEVHRRAESVRFLAHREVLPGGAGRIVDPP